MQDVTNTKDNLRNKASETRDKIADMGHMAKEAAQDTYQNLKDKTAEKYEEGKEKLQQFQDSVGKSVAEAPMKSVLIAAGVGLVLGWLWRRS